MNNRRNSRLTAAAKQLRRNMTPEERHLWYDFLKKLPVSFHRQKVFGNYIADFYCASAKLVVELDGSQHYQQAGLSADAQRDAFFRGQGIAVLRYSNADVNRKFASVCQDIWNHVPALRARPHNNLNSPQ